MIKLPLPTQLRLQSMYEQFKRAERSAADLLLNDPGFIAKATVQEAAARAGVSQPTFVRLARKLGYSGYAELKEILLRSEPDEEQAAGVMYSRLSANSTPYEVAQSIVFASIEALQDLIQVMEPKSYEAAVHAVFNAGKILFFGAGDSGIVAHSAYQKFLRIGVNCMTAEDYDTQMILAAQLGKDDVCVLVSYSGKSRTMRDIAKIARESGATTIAITNYPFSPLAKSCDILLLTATFVERGGEVVTQRITQLAIIESLYVACQLMGGKHMQPAIQAINKAIQYNKL